MGKLLQAYKKRDAVKFSKELKRLLRNHTTIKTESDSLPENLKKIWEVEDQEIALMRD